jgi:RNA polymerase-binding transcription factor DksA
MEESVDEIRRVLQRDLAWVNHIIGELEDHLGIADPASTPRPFLAHEMDCSRVDASMLDRMYRRADDLHHALQRLDDGTYGICSSCCGRIPTRQLWSRPERALCVDCERDSEIGTRRAGTGPLRREETRH